MRNANQLINHDRSNHHINRLRLIHICNVRLDVESPQLRLSEYQPSGYECGCRTCDRVFSSEEAFERHRLGNYLEGRKCAKYPATQGLALTSKGTWQRDRSTDHAGGDS